MIDVICIERYTYGGYETMSETEQFYYAVCNKFGITKKWGELHPVQQMQFVNAINTILQVVHS